MNFVRLALISSFLCICSLKVSASNMFKNFEHCSVPSKECLAEANQKIARSTPYTLPWFNLKLLQIESLISIKEFTAAEKAITAIKIENTPPLFSSYLTIYKAKVLIVSERRSQALKLIEEAKLNLIEINNSFYAPLRSIRIANLLLDLKRYDESLSILLSLERRFKNSKDDHFKLELYGNLGHLYRQTGDHQQSLAAYLSALPYAKALRHNQQIMVIYGHIGQAYVYLDNPQNAELMLKKALDYALLDGHDISITTSRLYLASFYARQFDKKNTQKELRFINPVYLNSYQVNTWNQLKAYTSHE